MRRNKLVEIIRSRQLASLRRKFWQIRDYLDYRPQRLYRARAITRGAFSSIALAESLNTRGICILENYLPRERLQECQALHEKLAMPLTYPDDPTIEPNSYTVTINFLTHPIFLDLVLDELVLAGIEAYYKRSICLAASQACRLYPMEPYEGTAFRWHHDCKGKYVKAMWLLTDVPLAGQRMSFIAGSHTIKHRWSTYEESRFKDEQVKGHGEVVECAAPAGSVVIFDTNGFHRGNRNLGPRRDMIFGAYSTGRYRVGCQFDLDMLPHLNDYQNAVLMRSKKASPCW